MEITSVHKYITLNELSNNQTEVLFAGQPCLFVNHAGASFAYTVNPVFAKLVGGIINYADVPKCTEVFETSEEAIAAGLVALFDIGAFKTEVDLPDDTNAIMPNEVFESYQRTKKELLSDIKSQCLSESTDLIDAHKSFAKFIKESKIEEFTVEYIKEESEDEKYEKWVSDVKSTHPTKNLRFKGRIEKGVHTISAEEKGIDRSYGVYSPDENTGKVFKIKESNSEEKEIPQIDEKALTPAEEYKREEIVKALKKDKKFVAKYGTDALYAIATAKAKESAE